MRHIQFHVFTICILLLATSCFKSKRQKVDKLIVAKAIYTMDSAMTVCEAMILDKGIIVARGNRDSLLEIYNPSESETVDGYIYPGFIDAHCHFLGLVKTKLSVDMQGAGSWEKVLEICKQYAAEHPDGWIQGRGWDQSLWKDNTLPDNKLLNELFPDRPVILRRVDGHAAVANEYALKLAGIQKHQFISGGEIVLDSNGNLTGLLIDNAMEPVLSMIQPPSKETLIKGIIKTGLELNKMGLTTLVDAGMDIEEVDLIDSLQQEGLLNLRFYAMLNANEKNLKAAKERGVVDNPMLVLRSFKFYADGALGSEGAKLKQPYCTKAVHNGLLLTDPEMLTWWYEQMYRLGYQSHTHCIGDSANAMVLNLYHKVMKAKPELRWRIEHAQVMDTADFELFKGIIPSIQPIHAASDRRWAKDKLCEHRMSGAYAYNSLLKHTGLLAIGTDFPVEPPSPLDNFKAATVRKHQTAEEWNGIFPNEGLTPVETLLGMTRWAAYSVFMDRYCGSLNIRLKADFIVLSHDLINEKIVDETEVQVIKTFFNGQDLSKLVN
jgi:predicted amidohydrolase YtcJ